MGQVLLVRHAQASFGSADYDRLSELGVEQARLLGASLASRGRRIDFAVTGSLKRHRQTAETCLAMLPAALQPAEASRAETDFNEYDADEVIARHRPEFTDPTLLQRHLEASGNPRRAFQDLFAVAMGRWMEGNHDDEYRESWTAFCRRCVAAVHRLIERAGPSRTSLVFTSGGPIAAIGKHLLELPDRRAFDLNLALVNSAVTGLLYQRGRISLSYLNNFAHLEQTGNAQVITYR